MERLKNNITTRIDIDEETGCWNFNGCIQSNGYGRITFKRKTMGAHRWSYEAFNGEIPNGFDVCHRCDNKRCVNPSHIFVGTRKVNIVDAKEKGRVANGEKLPQTKVFGERLSEMLSRITRGDKYIDIARDFNMTPQNVGKIAIKNNIRRNKSCLHEA